ncbi:MAG: hypothetical protein R6X02_00720 [Enhygromyxa sp.]
MKAQANAIIHRGPSWRIDEDDTWMGGPAFKGLERTMEVAETTEEVARTARRFGEDNGLHGKRLDGFVDEAVAKVASRRPLRPIAKGSLTDDVTGEGVDAD